MINFGYWNDEILKKYQDDLVKILSDLDMHVYVATEGMCILEDVSDEERAHNLTKKECIRLSEFFKDVADGMTETDGEDLPIELKKLVAKNGTPIREYPRTLAMIIEANVETDGVFCGDSNVIARICASIENDDIPNSLYDAVNSAHDDIQKEIDELVNHTTIDTVSNMSDVSEQAINLREKRNLMRKLRNWVNNKYGVKSNK